MAQAPDPTPEAARQVLLAQAYNPVFFGKLASAGHVPATADEAARLLDMGYRLYADRQEKVAAEVEARGSLVDYAHARLDQLQHRPERAVKAAAAAYGAQVPGLLDAAAVLAGALS